MTTNEKESDANIQSIHADRRVTLGVFLDSEIEDMPCDWTAEFGSFHMIVMGAKGSGKSSVAANLASEHQKLGFEIFAVDIRDEGAGLRSFLAANNRTEIAAKTIPSAATLISEIATICETSDLGADSIGRVLLIDNLSSLTETKLSDSVNTTLEKAKIINSLAAIALKGQNCNVCLIVTDDNEAEKNRVWCDTEAEYGFDRISLALSDKPLHKPYSHPGSSFAAGFLMQKRYDFQPQPIGFSMHPQSEKEYPIVSDFHRRTYVSGDKNKWNRIPLGVLEDFCLDPDNTQAIWDLKESPHMLIAGDTGSGKSSLMLHIFSECIARGFEISLIDGNENPDFLFRDVFRFGAVKYYAEDIDLAENLLTSAYEEIKYRLNAIRKAKRAFWADMPDRKRLPPKAIFIDEIVSLLSTDNLAKRSEVHSKLMRIAREGRAAGVHLIAATRNPNHLMLKGDFGNNFSARVIMGSPLFPIDDKFSNSQNLPEGSGMFSQILTDTPANVRFFWAGTPEEIAENSRDFAVNF